MFSFWKFFLDKFNFTYLLTAVLVVLGFSALIVIPKESAPEVRIPIAVTTTALPGASAEDVEQLISIPIEDQLASGLTDVKEITSTSRAGVSVVVVEFLASADLDQSIQDTKDEVDKVRDLPSDATDPAVSEVNFVDEPIVEFSVSSQLPMVDLLTLAEKVQEEIERIPGVSEVQKSGIAPREVQVIVRREALQRFGLSLSEVIAALSAANQSIPVGGLTISGVQYAVTLEGEIEDPLAIGDLPIARSGNVPIYVRDIAYVSSGLGSTESVSRLRVAEGAPQQAVAFSVFKQGGADVTRVSDAVVSRIEELKTDILADSETFVLFNTGDDVRADLRQLSSSGLQTVLLVFVVLMLALGTKEAVLAGLAIPMSFLLAFIGLNASGNTINFVSLFSLILAVGILVDSAIVITEGIHTKIAEGFNPKRATVEALKELHWPIVAGTMTTIAVFFPLFFISGVTGKFIASIPFTIIFVLIASLLVALALLPVYGQRFLRIRPNAKVSRFHARREELTEQLQNKYRTLLEKIVGNRRREKKFLRGITALLLVSLLLPAFGLVKTIFFPGEDTEYLFINLEQAQGTVLLVTDAAVREAEAVLMSHPDVDSFITTVGSLSAFTDGGGGSDKANISVTLTDKRSRSSEVISQEIRQQLDAVLLDTEVRIVELSSGPPVGAPISITLLSDADDALRASTGSIVQELQSVEGVRDIDTSLEDDGFEFVFTVDRERAALAGLDVRTVASYLRTAVYGGEATQIRVGGEDVDVRVRLDLNERAIDLRSNVETTVNALQNLTIKNRFGENIVLDTVLDVELTAANAKIERRDQQRKVDVTADLVDGYNVREVNAVIKDRVMNLGLSDAVQVDFGGENQETDQSFIDMGFALIYGVLLIIAILVIQFNSFRQAFIIISILPFILIGIFFGLTLTRQAVSFPSIMGFIAVAGIAVNNSIILIDVMNQLRAEHDGWQPKKIAIEGASRRLRPILLTTLTTVIGVVPLTYASAIWAPLAWSIIFGLSFAMVLTLVLVPVLYHRRLVKNQKNAA